MNTFEEYIYQRFVAELRSWPSAIAHDVYVVASYISLLDDDSRFAELSWNYNTLSKWQKCVSEGADEAEAKWNCAFWPHDDIVRVCKSAKYNRDHPDVEGIRLRDEYLRSYLPQYDLTDTEQGNLLRAADKEPFYAYSDGLINLRVWSS